MSNSFLTVFSSFFPCNFLLSCPIHLKLCRIVSMVVLHQFTTGISITMRGGGAGAIWHNVTFCRTIGLFLNKFLASPSYHTYIVAHHNLKISLQCIRTLKHFACCLTMEACAHRFFIFSPTTCWFILDSGCHNLIGPFCITYIYWRITLLPKPFQVPLQKSIQCNPAMLSTLSLLKYSGVILTSDFFIVILIQVLRLLETHPTSKTVA